MHEDLLCIICLSKLGVICKWDASAILHVEEKPE